MPATPAAVWAALQKSRPLAAARGMTRNEINGEPTMYSFTFHRPETLRQAINLLSKNEDAKLLAGGHTLLPTMKLRLAGPPQLIDLSRIEGLAGIELKGRSLVIGAMTAMPMCTLRRWCSRPFRCSPSSPA